MGKKTFFIVEDHTVTNLGLKSLIEEKIGADCLGTAFTKTEAEEKLEKLTALPDIIILDLFLGKESGLELLQVIRKNYPSVKVLVYSMYSKPGILSLTLEHGAHGFVDKSAAESVLITAITSILNGETYVQQNLISPLFTYKTMYDGLTKQEQRIFNKLLEQKSKTQIAEELNIVPRTVDNYISRILDKTGCHGKDEIVGKFAK